MVFCTYVTLQTSKPRVTPPLPIFSPHSSSMITFRERRSGGRSSREWRKQERKDVENESKRKALKKEMKVYKKQREKTQNTGEEMSGENVMERSRYNI